jgi:hypothetical protein
VDRVLPDTCPSSDRDHVSRPNARLGLHVDIVILNLFRIEMANVVANPRSNRAQRREVHRLSAGVAGNGRGSLPINRSEFWGKRWNLGFRQLAHEFIFRPLQKTHRRLVK